MGVEGVTASGEVADASGGSALDPEDCVAVAGFEKKGEVGADVGGAFAEARGLFDVFDALKFAFETGEGVEGSGVVVAALFEELFAEVEGHAAYATSGVGGEGGE